MRKKTRACKKSPNNLIPSSYQSRVATKDRRRLPRVRYFSERGEMKKRCRSAYLEKGEKGHRFRRGVGERVPLEICRKKGVELRKDTLVYRRKGVKASRVCDGRGFTGGTNSANLQETVKRIHRRRKTGHTNKFYLTKPTSMGRSNSPIYMINSAVNHPARNGGQEKIRAREAKFLRGN